MVVRPLRVIDTGVHTGRYNVALDQALIDGRRACTSPDTLRFLEFSPSALVGRHQDVGREIDLEYCRTHAIDVGRRVTGGGAIYLDRNQLGWELICARGTLSGADLAAVAMQVCSGAAAGLARLGIDARFRPRNDIEVDGRKISGTGGFFDGDTLFYQGTLIIDLDAETMFRVLRVPPEKRFRQCLEEARARVTSLNDHFAGGVPAATAIKSALTAGLAGALGFDAHAGALSADESAAAKRVYTEEVGRVEFVHEIDGVGSESGWLTASRATAGGTLTAAVQLAALGTRRLAQLLLSGDYFVTPPRVVYDLECALKDVPVTDVAVRVREFFENADVELMSFTSDDVVAVIEAAVGEDVRGQAWTTSPV